MGDRPVPRKFHRTLPASDLKNSRRSNRTGTDSLGDSPFARDGDETVEFRRESRPLKRDVARDATAERDARQLGIKIAKHFSTRDLGGARGN